MRNFLSILSITLLLLTSCFHNRWSEKERKDFEIKCAQTDTFKNLMVQFYGFENKEFDSIQIKKFNHNVLIDSFVLFVRPATGGGMRSLVIERTLNINNKYQFIISGQKPYELANMKMIMWAEYTMTSEGYGCVMGEYSIDSVRFEHDAKPTFIKRL